MKLNLCVTVFTLLVIRTKQISDIFNLLPLEVVNEYADDEPPYDDSAPGQFSLNFTGNHARIPLNRLDFGGQTIYTPYIIHIKFKPAKVTSSLFSIEDSKEAKMMVHFATAGTDTTRITLTILGKELTHFDVEDLVGNWNDLIIYVKEDEATIYQECAEVKRNTIAREKREVEFPMDAFLVLGKSELYPAYDIFNGSILDLKIHTEADDSTRRSLCTDASHILDKVDRSIPSTDYYDTEETTTVELKPENIRRGDGGISGTPKPDLAPPKGDKGERGEVGERGFKGEKGEKGEIGTQGIPGASTRGDIGPRGPPGLEGPIGKRGKEGQCKCSEIVVSSLLRTMPEMKGPPGEPGLQGVEGPRGMTGSTGHHGPQGEKGAEGPRGERGERGYPGTPGQDGKPGLNGQPGRDGTPGSPGPEGQVGPPGPPGPGYVETDEDKKARTVIIPGERGDPGPQGPPGPIGPQGETGARGDKGEPGLKGDTGEQGPIGLDGLRGEKGERGENGRDGRNGIPGNHGKDGLMGKEGEKGDKGSPGLAGIPASLSELLDPDMDPHENAQIVEKLRGLKGDVGPTGGKGPKGDKGESGSPGVSGKDGIDGEKGPHGPQGPRGHEGSIGPRGLKGDQGPPGPAGLVPASDIALLKGSKGERGERGQRGDRGPTGHIGKTGGVGKNGPKGDRGDMGPAGPVGPMGLSGYNGTIGEKGQKGECAVPTNFTRFKGDKGDRGDPGTRGNDGKVGPQGPAGICSECNKIPIIGAPGPPGPPGPPGLSISGPKGEPGGIVTDNTLYSFGFEIKGKSGFQEDDDFHVTTTVMFRTTKALIRRTSETPLGTLAYVLQENILLIRVERGWRYVKMESLLAMREPTLTPTSATTLAPTPASPPSPKVHHVWPTEPPSPRPPHYNERLRSTDKYIRIAALNDPYSGKVYSPMSIGHRAADHLCNQQSKNYGGNFRAFLTDKVMNLNSIVNRNQWRLPVTNLKGEVLFSSWESLFRNSGARFLNDPNIYSFNMKNVLIDQHWPNKVVWHGSDPRGGIRDDSFCNAWESDRYSDRGLASSFSSGQLLGQEFFSCNNQLVVLCVEVSAADRRKRHSLKRIHTNRRFNKNYIGG